MLSRRAYSSAASALKVAARDSASELTTLSVVVKNAGSKNGAKSGLSHLLSKYTFLNTQSKSALRFARESELLGGAFSSQVTRDALILNTQFLKADLPYYVEALGNVLAGTQFRPHEYVEVVLPAARAEYQAARLDNAYNALEELHAISFRKGLGNPLLYDGTTPISSEEVQQFAQESFKSGNVSVLADGANSEDLLGFVQESLLTQLPAGASESTPVEIFKGKESRIRASGQSVALIGVPIKPADFGKYEVLSAAIGSAILPSANTQLGKIGGASQVYKYQDAGLFVVSVSGTGAQVAQGIKQAKKIVDSVANSELTNAVKSAELALALQSSVVSPADVKVEAAQAPLGDFNYVAIGDVDVLPYASDL
ncbi:ubiquinol-cytochrome-c reductase complex core protein 2 mitochondrial precursor [Spathaspora passalidarum NRRL Y-27907]|uniref:Cytochrome b-c1 complex subunit 2, mitochondrial n=1 Tax=Spathaspora passalidarum (strain NRRL Y-27907 / 11-Y1) TaxID=619300 RepID=G3APJ0_SPAPN|nr:ubiquinol-cytochrome-c reductase complex core protein 2 mitochondrial precursor [Spathaspora passalidarum NRRL Y-27907]EGW32161.1 ubiquinol-cytochrome-c reductase complex core protein 2 mitochondrial precursor [Spathaspora passalidarum NRRL Y-27907]